MISCHAPLLAGQPVAIDQRCYERHETQEGKRREGIVAVPNCDSQQRQCAEQAEARAQRLAAKLRSLGIGENGSDPT